MIGISGRMQPDFPDGFEPFDVRHENIGDQQVGGLLFDMLDRAAAILKGHHVMASRFQHAAHDAAYAWLVVDHKDLGHGAYSKFTVQNSIAQVFSSSGLFGQLPEN